MSATTRAARVALLALLTGLGSAQAAPVLQVVGGFLVGAQGVEMGGTLYDVEFLDGTCAGVFGTCDPATPFEFQTGPQALAASAALLSQVFIDGPSGNFDSVPSLTRGCFGTADCRVHTPYDAFGGTVNTAATLNTQLIDLSQFEVISASNDLTDVAGRTWARWSLSGPPVGTVPEPGVLTLVGSALLALVWSRRSRPGRGSFSRRQPGT
jgi:hypothetical protein